MQRNVHIEVLESRSLLSVTAATLAFPMTPGAHWTTEDDDGTTDALAVVGTGSINGNTGTKFTDHEESPGSDPTDDTTIFGFDNAKDLVYYGTTTVSTDTSSDPPDTTTTVEYFSPYHVQYPAVMVAGHVYSYSGTLHADTSSTSGDSDSNSSSDSYSIKLVSDTMQKITVPAGTFMCYELDATDTYTNSEGKSATITSQEFISPGNYPSRASVRAEQHHDDGAHQQQREEDAGQGGVHHAAVRRPGG